MKLLILLLFFSLGTGKAVAQANLIETTIEVTGTNKKPVNTMLFIVPNAPGDTIAIYINGKKFVHKMVYGTDSVRLATAVHYEVKTNNILQVTCGVFKTKPIKFANTKRFCYISMTDKDCTVYLSDSYMRWEDN